MRVLTNNTGRGQLKVLSVLAEKEGELKHKEIVERSSLTKGAVTNNIQKLKEKNLVLEESNKLNETRLVELYREHLETFLIRESSEPEQLNELRTYVKKQIPELIDKPEIKQTLLSVLENSRKRTDLESLNSVFKETNRIFREETEDKQVKMLGLVTDKSNTIKKNPKVAKEAEKVLNEVTNK
ncbi:MAG: MarR family transcriptional regulator [Candidatus Nanohalobium sp.]